ncbi:MAG: hypothetical protein QXM75_01950 [Candidatus Diapherotrites archaeon]
MNFRGAIYSTTVAMIVMATLALVMYSNIAMLNQAKYVSYVSNISDLKLHWMNIRFVLDQATGEALADYIKDANRLGQGCDARKISDSNAQAWVQEYINRTLNKVADNIEGEINCTVGPITYTPSAGNTPSSASIAISFILTCNQELKAGNTTEFYASYSANVNFNKRIETSGANCIVVAYDAQSNTVDANTWY